MEKYTLRGEYPNGVQFQARIECEGWNEAAILAQGAQRVTTLKYCEAVREDGSIACVFGRKHVIM